MFASVRRSLAVGHVASVVLALTLSATGVLVDGAAAATTTTATAVAVADRAAAGAARPAGPSPELHWSDCGGHHRQCATVDVPLDYDEPGGPSISLAVTRLPATDPAHRIGSLFVNPGGPGGSGLAFLEALATNGTARWPAEVLARFDVVSFDPRGVGASTPVRCFDNDQDRAAFEADYLSFPATREQEGQVARQAAELAARCWERSASLLPHLGTANVARDLDVLRRAVGDERLTYVGYSYGTYLGEVYANLFPGRLRALVLDGVINPISYSSARPGLVGGVPGLRMGSDVASSEALGQFLDSCAAAGDACPFARGGNPRAKFATLVERLRAQASSPDSGSGASRATYQQVLELTVRSLYDPARWRGLGRVLESLYAPADPVTPPNARPAALSPGERADPAFVAILCADSDVPHHPERWPAVAAAAERRAPYTGTPWAYEALPCASWRQKDADRYQGPWGRPTSAPALLLSTVHDPATPHHDAREVQQLMPGSRLVTLDGWGHTTMGQSACVNQLLTAYLLDGALPPDGTTCPPDHRPFETPSAPGLPVAGLLAPY